MQDDGPDTDAVVLDLFVGADIDRDNALSAAEFAIALRRATSRSTAERISAEAPQAARRLRRLFQDACSSAKQAGPVARGMDNVQFARFCREAGLLARGGMDATTADLLFVAVKPRGERRITLQQFMTVVDLMAQKLGVPLETLAAAMPETLAKPHVSIKAGVAQQTADRGIRSYRDVFERLSLSPAVAAERGAMRGGASTPADPHTRLGCAELPPLVSRGHAQKGW